MKKNRQTGFTLIEVLIVIVVIAVLAAVIIPPCMRASRHAEAKAAKKFLDTIATAKTVDELQALSRTALTGPELLKAGAKRITDDPVTYEQRFVLTPAGIKKPVLFALDQYGTMLTRIEPYDAEAERLKTCARLQVTFVLPVEESGKIRFDNAEYTPTELAEMLGNSGKLEAKLEVPRGDHRATLTLPTMTGVQDVPEVAAEAPSGR